MESGHANTKGTEADRLSELEEQRESHHTSVAANHPSANDTEDDRILNEQAVKPDSKSKRLRRKKKANPATEHKESKQQLISRRQTPAGANELSSENDPPSEASTYVRARRFKHKNDDHRKITAVKEGQSVRGKDNHDKTKGGNSKEVGKKSPTARARRFKQRNGKGQDPAVTAEKEKLSFNGKDALEKSPQRQRMGLKARMKARAQSQQHATDENNHPREEGTQLETFSWDTNPYNTITANSNDTNFENEDLPIEYFARDDLGDPQIINDDPSSEMEEVFKAELAPQQDVSELVLATVLAGKAEGDVSTSNRLWYWVVGAVLCLIFSVASVFVVVLVLLESEGNASIKQVSPSPTSVLTSEPTLSLTALPTFTPVVVTTREELRVRVRRYMIAVAQGETPDGPPMGLWDVSRLTDMQAVFYAHDDLVFMKDVFNEDIADWNVSLVTDMSRLFSFCRVFNQDISRWDVSRVESTNSMFTEAGAFNQDLNDWKVSKVTTLSFMFLGAAMFNQNLSRWDVSRVQSLYGTFLNAVRFNGDVTTWNISSTTTLHGMFHNALAFNQDLSRWDTSNVVSIQGVFRRSIFGTLEWSIRFGSEEVLDYVDKTLSSFNGDISRWNTSRVTNMNGAFYNANSFNRDISNWDTSRTRSMIRTFAFTTSFNGDISRWDVSRVTSMEQMFDWATAFNHDISRWNISSVVQVTEMFSYSSFGHNLCGWRETLMANNVVLTDMFADNTHCSAVVDSAASCPENCSLPPTSMCHACE